MVVSGYAGLPGLTEEVVAVLQKPLNAPWLLTGLCRALSHDLADGAGRTLD